MEDTPLQLFSSIPVTPRKINAIHNWNNAENVSAMFPLNVIKPC